MQCLVRRYKKGAKVYYEIIVQTNKDNKKIEN